LEQRGDLKAVSPKIGYGTLSLRFPLKSKPIQRGSGALATSLVGTLARKRSLRREQ